MTAHQPLQAFLRLLEEQPVLRSQFSEEQRAKYRIVADRLSQPDSGRPFRVVFCGVFSSGKTSLINSLLAADY